MTAPSSISKRRGVLLLNLGTPEEPNPRQVGKYLREFLMDPLVVDIPWLARWFLVNVLIVPRRSYASAELYQKVWTDRGSPLMFHTVDLAKKVRARLGPEVHVEVAMRYGKPSVRGAFEAFRSARIQEVVALPLYPQYSLSATESSIAEIRKQAGTVNVSIVPPFYAEEAYLDAVTKVSTPHLERPHDFVLFSFHGLPERHVKRTDPTAAHCLADKSCCDKMVKANEDCYRMQCYETARQLAKRLGLSSDKYTVAFQSRLGRTPWIQPFSDELYREFPKRGLKRVAVMSPSFVADCLETLEEIAIRGHEDFRKHGGEELFLVPSLNSEDIWADAVVKLVEKYGLSAV